ncbi:hypothetical protein K456DRAFT_1718982 [Colletotrichum gloeosporioides 23]|nr:hypothetical protein K456DRAFT_1718982 [Colletotrichum gloeosporioides 23]KAJ0274339.1 hypothetical protein COL940_009407 [Colletotrichum noveboracense]KAJ0280926.1 hypothetical protein CBS470a_008558 [Colletotrichum nupharicola]KAJ0311671.1 hypothetical protein Brms1b_008117 [Colletotrichum noveboracense]
MYGSYGSYSSMGAMSISAPIDIGSSNMLAHDRSCAFPSWPRRETLADFDGEPRATSYLSDEDLFPQDFEDDAHSVSSHGSFSSPNSRSPQITEAELLEMERERMAMQREAMRCVMLEKERRRQQALKQKQARRCSSKKSPKSKSSAMAPIAE